MSVLIETSAGEVVVDLFVEDCPKACENFIKLCKLKYYNNCLVFEVQRNHIIQTGDPTGNGEGGCSVWGRTGNRPPPGFFSDEVIPHLRFNKSGLLCMANKGPNTNTSQFFFTLRNTDLEYLEEKHTIFGQVAEGLDTTLKAINDVELDLKGRPYYDVRILHTFVLDDPFEGTPDEEAALAKFERTSDAARPEEEVVTARVAWGTDINDKGGKTEEEIEKQRKDKEAQSKAQVLTILGDIPDADVKPPDNVLFVCKLNAITEDEDLELLFSRFGEIKSCEVIRDKKTGDSLNYAFIEFATDEQCQEAYFKMNNVVIDDRRIKVDFSQSVSKLWNKWALAGGGSKRVAENRVSQRAHLGMEDTKRHASSDGRRGEARRSSTDPKRSSTDPKRSSTDPRRSSTDPKRSKRRSATRHSDYSSRARDRRRRSSGRDSRRRSPEREKRRRSSPMQGSSRRRGRSRSRGRR